MLDKNTNIMVSDTQKPHDQEPTGCTSTSISMPCNDAHVESAVSNSLGKTVPTPALALRCLAASFSVVRRAQPMLAVPIIGTKVCGDLGLLAQDAPLSNYYALGLLSLEMIAEAIEFFYPPGTASTRCEGESLSYQQLHQLMRIAAHAHIDNIRGDLTPATSSFVSLEDKQGLEKIAIGLGLLIRLPGRLLLLYPGLKALWDAVYHMFQQLLEESSAVESSALASGMGYALIASSFVGMVARILIANPHVPDRPAMILGVTHVDAVIKNIFMPMLPERFLKAIRPVSEKIDIGISYRGVSMMCGMFSALAPIAVLLCAPFAIFSRIGSDLGSLPGDLSFNHVMYAACTGLLMSFVSLLCTLITLPELPSMPALGVILASLALPLSGLAARGHAIIDALDAALTLVWPVSHTEQPSETTPLRQSMSDLPQYYGSASSTTPTFFTQPGELTRSVLVVSSVTLVKDANVTGEENKGP